MCLNEWGPHAPDRFWDGCFDLRRRFTAHVCVCWVDGSEISGWVEEAMDKIDGWMDTWVGRICGFDARTDGMDGCM